MTELAALVAKLERITTGLLPGVWLSSDEAEQTITFHLAPKITAPAEHRHHHFGKAS